LNRDADTTKTSFTAGAGRLAALVALDGNTAVVDTSLSRLAVRAASCRLEDRCALATDADVADTTVRAAFVGSLDRSAFGADAKAASLAGLLALTHGGREGLAIDGDADISNTRGAGVASQAGLTAVFGIAAGINSSALSKNAYAVRRACLLVLAAARSALEKSDTLARDTILTTAAAIQTTLARAVTADANVESAAFAVCTHFTACTSAAALSTALGVLTSVKSKTVATAAEVVSRTCLASALLHVVKDIDAKGTNEHLTARASLRWWVDD